MKAKQVNAGLAESNGRLLLGICRDSLHVTCGLTACTPGSAPGPTLGNEYGKTFTFIKRLIHERQAGPFFLPQGVDTLQCWHWRWRKLQWHSVTFILISGRSSEPLMSSSAALNPVDVRPTSQCWALSPAALFSAAFDCRWRWLSRFFTWRHIFSSTFSFCMIQPTYLLADWSCYATSFFLSSNHRLSRITTALATWR